MSAASFDSSAQRRDKTMMSFLLLLAAQQLVADQEVAIEVPLADSYAISAKKLAIEDAGGYASSTAKVTLALCDGALCPPLANLQPPIELKGDGPVRVNDRKLKGSLWAIVNDGALTLVNRLPLEEYLVATVGSEMPKSFPPEALKAQAVAARTFALQRKISREGSVTHLRSSTLDQVYGGLVNETPETRAAVMATQGEVLVYDRQPIEAFFFSSCSGQTRDGNTVFHGDYPYLKSVSCSCEHAAWSARLPFAELTKKLGEKVSGLSIEGASGDGRPEAVVVEPSGTRIAPEDLRKKLGYTVVKSADLRVDCDKSGCRLAGAGYGHGVGMCQHGAKAMALAGKTYKEILAHYYPGAQLKKL